MPLTINVTMVAVCRIEFRRNDDGCECTACCTRSSGFDSFVRQECKPDDSKRSATDGGNRLNRNCSHVSMWMQEVNITRVKPSNLNSADHSLRPVLWLGLFSLAECWSRGLVPHPKALNSVCVFILCLCYTVCMQRPYDQLIPRLRSPTACG
jgi:hypothetical protein